MKLKKKKTFIVYCCELGCGFKEFYLYLTPWYQIHLKLKLIYFTIFLVLNKHNS